MTGKTIFIAIIGIALAVVIIVGTQIHFSKTKNPVTNPINELENQPNVANQDLPVEISAEQIKKNAIEVKAIAEKETIRISDAVNASVQQKEKIGKLFADFYSDSFSLPPDRAPIACEKFETQLKEILSKEQQTKLGLK